ncbi:MAG: hypothetical protein JSS49_27405 [Planctomycetes bacterium]|nr:hypothetical protein [Planctomycetota bacterium]
MQNYDISPENLLSNAYDSQSRLCEMDNGNAWEAFLTSADRRFADHFANCDDGQFMVFELGRFLDLAARLAQRGDTRFAGEIDTLRPVYEKWNRVWYLRSVSENDQTQARDEERMEDE